MVLTVFHPNISLIAEAMKSYSWGVCRLLTVVTYLVAFGKSEGVTNVSDLSLHSLKKELEEGE